MHLIVFFRRDVDKTLLIAVGDYVCRTPTLMGVAHVCGKLRGGDVLKGELPLYGRGLAWAVYILCNAQPPIARLHNKASPN